MGLKCSGFMGRAKIRQDIDVSSPAPVGAQGSSVLEPLASRLGRFSNFDAGDLLRPLVTDLRSFERDTPAWAQRGDLASVAVIETGWAYKFSILHDGRRHIADFFGPGAICNWSRLSRFEEQDDILFKSGTSVALLAPQQLEEKLAVDASLSSVIKRHELARAMRTTQRIRAFISLPAIERTLVLLLDLVDELTTVRNVPEWIEIPFAQAEIADMLGLTPVHVSRVLKKLVDTGVIERDGASIRIEDRQAIERDLAYRHFFKRRKVA